MADIGIRGGKKLREKLEAAKDDVLLYRSITAISLEAPLSVHHDLLVPGAIDISGITNGASISRTLTNGTRFKLDPDNDGTYEMEWELDDYTGTADQVTVLT